MRKRLRKKLSSSLANEELKQIYDSFDIIGDIAIFKTAQEKAPSARMVAGQIMAIHKSVKTVFMQTGAVSGDFRVRELNLVAGEKKTVCKYKEAGCIFAVDVQKCYFSPRLSFERQRIASLVNNGEVVVNMFSGVGCFSIILAKKHDETKVFSIDINPTAFLYMVENVRINRLFNRVIPLLGDSKDIIQNQLKGVADRVLMPLPELSLSYLPLAVMALKPSGGWIHLYDFQHALGRDNPLEKTRIKVAGKLDDLGVDYKFGICRIIRSTGPNWYQTVLDIEISLRQASFNS